MKRIEIIYCITIILSVILFVGTAGALEAGVIPLTIAAWQSAGAAALCGIGTFGYWLEETRAARRIHHRKYGL